MVIHRWYTFPSDRSRRSEPPSENETLNTRWGDVIVPAHPKNRQSTRKSNSALVRHTPLLVGKQVEYIRRSINVLPSVPVSIRIPRVTLPNLHSGVARGRLRIKDLRHSMTQHAYRYAVGVGKTSLGLSPFYSPSGVVSGMQCNIYHKCLT